MHARSRDHQPHGQPIKSASPQPARVSAPPSSFGTYDEPNAVGEGAISSIDDAPVGRRRVLRTPMAAAIQPDGAIFLLRVGWPSRWPVYGPVLAENRSDPRKDSALYFPIWLFLGYKVVAPAVSGLSSSTVVTFGSFFRNQGRPCQGCRSRGGLTSFLVHPCYRIPLSAGFFRRFVCLAQAAVWRPGRRWCAGANARRVFGSPGAPPGFPGAFSSVATA